MENVRISAAVPDLKWLHNPACKIQKSGLLQHAMIFQEIVTAERLYNYSSKVASMIIGFIVMFSDD